MTVSSPSRSPGGLREYRLEPLGESYVLATFTDSDADDRWRHAHSICRSLESMRYDAVLSVYPAYDSVLIEYDAARIDSEGMCRIVEGLTATYSHADEEWLSATVTYRLPVCFGFDLEAIAAELDMSPSELIELEASAPIRIRCRGVGGGLMMLNHSTVPPVSRLASPVIRETHGGEFNLAGVQCSIGLSSGRATTGWRSIGRTPVDVASEFRRPTASFHLGDSVRLDPITADAWAEHEGRPVATVGVAS